MLLNQRPARSEDIAPCFNSLGEPFSYHAATRDRVPALLQRWLANGQIVAHVIEDISRLRHPKPVGFSVVVFVAESFAAELRQGAMPFARAELARREMAGEAIALTTGQIREANQGDGLNLLYFNLGLTNRDLSDDDLHRVHARWADTFLELRGFHLQEIFCEALDEKIAQMGISCGMRPRFEWRQIMLESGGTPMDVFQIGTRDNEMTNRRGTPASHLFTKSTPRFGFTERHQELLKQALQGSTDAELAAELFISLPAVKKRWVAIYEQVSACEPGWLDAADSAPLSGEFRGSEKRRRLLNYLRQHPEELHPANARC